MTAEAALQAQLSLIERERFSHSSPIVRGVQLDGQDSAAAHFLQALKVAVPYSWAWQICELVELTARATPPWRLSPADLVTPHGFAWFDRSLPLVNPYRTAGRGPGGSGLSGRYLLGFCWMSAGDGIWLYSIYDGNPVVMPGRGQVGGAHRLGRALRWRFGSTIRDAILSVDDPQRLGRVVHELGYLSACLLFVTQRVVRIAPEPRTDRQPGDRAPRPLEPAPLIRIVQLRRVSTRRRDDGDGSQPGPVAWSHRWLVSAHWRQQWYPSTGEHRPLLILPYTKGPADRPLKPPRALVYDVVR